MLSLALLTMSFYGVDDSIDHLDHMIEQKRPVKRRLSRLIERPIDQAKRLYLNPKYIQLVKTHNRTADTKSIVDRPTKRPLNEVLEALEAANEHDIEQAQAFVRDYLAEPGSDLIQSALIDWNERPALVEKLTSNELKHFTIELNKIWLDLARAYDSNILKNGYISSHLQMKNPFLVPGGRFDEMYYWDSYWVMEGLLACGFHITVKHMIENFVHIIQEFGFIPNGTRIYYLNRSQPPYFPHMVLSYYNYIVQTERLTQEEKQKEVEFVFNECLPCMVEEHNFWMLKRRVEVEINDQVFVLNRFNVDTVDPRPESYFEDLETAHHMSHEEREQVFRDKASAAESGYDFSSRWQEDPLDLRTTKTSKIIPVDLNAIIFKNELIISQFYLELGNIKLGKRYENAAKQREIAINALMWSNEHSYWCDFDLDRKDKNTRNFYVSNLIPLCLGIRPPGRCINEIINLNKDLLMKFECGIPVSFIESGEQWDYPNLWAPNQHSLIYLLIDYDYDFALKLAKDFFHTVYHGWKKTGLIYEKYNAKEAGGRGFGGEYEIQTGFGWTNGTIFALIDTFGDKLLE